MAGTNKNNSNIKKKKKPKIKQKGKAAPIFFLAAILALPALDIFVLAGQSLVNRSQLPFSKNTDRHTSTFGVNEPGVVHSIKLDTHASDVVLAWKLTHDGAVINANEERYPATGVRRVDFKPDRKGQYAISVRRIEGKKPTPATLDIKVIAGDRQLIMPIFDSIGL